MHLDENPEIRYVSQILTRKVKLQESIIAFQMGEVFLFTLCRGEIHLPEKNVVVVPVSYKTKNILQHVENSSPLACIKFYLEKGTIPYELILREAMYKELYG